MAIDTKQPVEVLPHIWRVQKAKERVLATKPSIDLENARILTESFMKTEGEPVVVKKAKGFREQCQRKTVSIWDDELIVGCIGSKIRGGILCPNTCWPVLDKELETIPTRLQDPFQISEEDKKLFKDFIKPYWKGRSLQEAWRARMPDELRQLMDNAVIFADLRVIRGPGELTAGYEWVITEGINGIRKKIEEKLASLDAATYEGYEKSIYLNALLIACDGIVTLAKRYAQLAEKMASEEKDPRRKGELEKIAEICDWVPANPARTFWEAMQSFYFYQTCIIMQEQAPSYNPGRMDQYLYPYYKKDIEKGLITKEQAQELFNCLWIKLAESCLFQDERTAKYAAGYMMFQNTSCGGITKSGLDAVNELSYMMIQATMDVRLYQPSLSIRYNKEKNPDSFLRKVVDLVAVGIGFPSIFNDAIGIKMVLHKGVPLEEANNWNPCGCVETNLTGKMRTYTDYAHMNLGSAVEFALTDGVQRLTKVKLAAQTGDPRKFKSFQEFKEAIKAQLAHLIRKAVEINQVLESVVGEIRPVPVVSLSFKECVESARDYEWGGAKYSLGNAISLVGVADIIDSLATVKKLIYEDKALSWDTLLEALDSNFEGHEEIRRMCLSTPKYGNDIGEVDEIATEIIQFIAEEIGKYRGKHGKMLCGILPVTAHIPGGLLVGALPSGRKACVPLSDGLSPMQGTDVNGPTAILKSVSKINHSMYGSGTLLNMKLDPPLLKDERGKTTLMSLLKSMCDLGVYHIQINVISPETLREAQKYPERHRNLLVRVAGYTAYFVELEKTVQDEIISRTTQMSLS
jgi:formate C-acetyltransferase